MFQPSTTASILPISNPSSAQNQSSGYSWKTWAKAGLVFATTTGVFLTLKATGSFSLISAWLRNNPSGTNRLIEVRNDLVVSGQVGVNVNLYEHAMQHEADKAAHESNGLIDFKELLSHDFQKRSGSLFPAVIELSNLNGTAGFKLDGEIDNNSGWSVSRAGDFNGDDIADLILGAPEDPFGSGTGGRSYVVFGHRSSWPGLLELSSLDGSNGIKLYGEVDWDYSGYSVSGAKDINGDGIDDIIVGAYQADPSGRRDAGRSYVVFGHSGNWPEALELSSLNGSTGFKINGEVAGDMSGSSVSGVGDINGDGVDDFIIGSPGADPSERSGAGRSYVIFGHRSSWPGLLELSSLDGSNGVKLDGEVDRDNSAAVSGAGDINGDGVDDFIIGASGADPSGKISAGRSYLIFGHNGSWPGVLELSSLNGSSGFKLNGETAEDYSGGSVSKAGDINGDGIDDIIIGAHGANPSGRSGAGRSYVVFGHKGSWPAVLELASLDGSSGFKLNGEAAYDSSGRVSGAGDINGDGIDDIIIGAPQADPSGRNAAGRSYMVFGHKGSWPAVVELASLDGNNGFKLDGESVVDNSGVSVSGAGDINGDGVDDTIVGAWWANPPGCVGRGYVIFGRSPQFLSSAASSSSSSHLSGTPSISNASQSSSAYLSSVTSTSSPTSTPTNNPPQLTNNQMILDSTSQTIVLTPEMLSATDPDDNDADLIFTMSNIHYGQFEYIVNPGVAITSCTQQDIIDGNVQFVRDGSVYNPAYTVSVSDGTSTTTPTAVTLIFSDINNIPQLINNQIAMYQGETITITRDMLYAHDVENAPKDLLFTITDVQNGHFERAGNLGTEIYRFTQQEIDAGEIILVHDGSNIAPKFYVSVTDYTYNTSPERCNIQLLDVNDAPYFVNNQFIINQAQIMLITPEMLTITDPDNLPADLAITITDLQYGQFENVNNPGIAITSFTQQDINNNQIQFVHDGSSNTPSFTINVTDGEFNITETAVVSGIERMSLVRNKLIIGNNMQVVLSPAFLQARHLTMSAAELIFDASALQHGYFALIRDLATPVTSFVQDRVMNRQLYFAHDGSYIPPSYNISISDGAYYTLPQAAIISFNNATYTNDMPQLFNNRLIIQQDAAVVLTANDFSAGDRDSLDGNLIFTPGSITHGKFTLVNDLETGVTSFTQQQVIDNEVQFVHQEGKGAPTFLMSVSDGDLTTTPILTNITFIAKDKGANTLAIALGIVGGILVCGITAGGVVGGLMWRRYLSNRSQDKLGDIELESEKLPWRKIRQIGRGGNAEVDEAEWTGSGSWQGKHVAIKRLPEMLAEVPEATEEFKREGEFLEKYRHPNLIEFVGFFGAPYWCLVLKYYYRGSLDKVLGDKQYELPWNPERNGFMTGIGRGLEFLHSKGIIHRDMKPGNVLIDEDMRPKITDLGTARIQDTLSMTKGVGTPAYIAPEVVTTGGDIRYDKSVDVYSYGMILWAIWQRKEPFLEFEQAWQIINYTASGQRPLLEGCPSPRLASLVGRCWAHRALDRPSMLEVCEELNTVTAELAFA